MNGYKTLEKLYKIREREMNDAQQQFNRAIEHFEKVGQKLFDLLKTKEQTEEQIQQQMKKRMKIIQLNHYEIYHQTLENEEKDLQMKVHQARVNMNNKQQNLTYAHQELKKLEKMIEKKKEDINEQMKRVEMKFIDEVSVQQFIRQK
ncbi:flagellar export protein FliJ [Bacillaceae bacterium W0354]